jgi:hypothetical protein
LDLKVKAREKKNIVTSSKTKSENTENNNTGFCQYGDFFKEPLNFSFSAEE